MKTTVHRRDDCRLCGQNKLDLVLNLGKTPLADAYLPTKEAAVALEQYPLNLYLCSSCGFVQLLDEIQPEGIYSDYIYRTTSSVGLGDHFFRYADTLISSLGVEPGKLVVDLGSNDGTLLKAFLRNDMNVLGVEPASKIAQEAVHEGIPTVCDFFSANLGPALCAEHGPAALITANNLVANIPDLNDFMQGIVALLDDEGVFVFESFYLVEQIRNMVFDFAYHEHLSYFTLTSLIPFFNKHGLEVFDAEAIPTKGGSLRYFVQHKGGKYEATRRMQELLDMEDAEEVATTECFRIWSKKINAAKYAVRSKLAEYRRTGLRIDGYGASATTTTLMHHFELHEFAEALYDENPDKQGLYSPGMGLPVLPPEKIVERNPDVIVLLAWRFAEIIHDKMAASFPDIRWLVPLPACHVIAEHG